MYVENATFVCRGLTETRDVYLQSWVNMGHQKDGLVHRERATLLWYAEKSLDLACMYRVSPTTDLTREEKGENTFLTQMEGL